MILKLKVVIIRVWKYLESIVMVIMMLYLVLLDVEHKRQFIKYFDTEFEMDKFIRKLRYSNKLTVVKDSRRIYYPYVD